MSPHSSDAPYRLTALVDFALVGVGVVCQSKKRISKKKQAKEARANRAQFSSQATSQHSLALTILHQPKAIQPHPRLTWHLANQRTRHSLLTQHLSACPLWCSGINCLVT